MFFKNFLENTKNKWSNKDSRKIRIISLLIGLVVISCFIYVFLTQPGSLIRDSFAKTFNGITEIRHVQVYSGPKVIREYVGRYGIEQYHGYLVIMNYDTGERIDIYGSTAVIINSAPLEEAEQE